MATWADLPFELKRLVFDALEASEVQSQKRSKRSSAAARRKRGRRVLAPLATLSTEWRDAVEAMTFKELHVRGSEVNEFAALFAGNARRQALLRHVTLEVQLPRYDSRLARSFETMEDQEDNDEVFSDTLWHMFEAMAAWDADVRQHSASRTPHGGLAFELLVRSPSDKPSLFGERGLAEDGQSRFFESQIEINIGAMHEPRGTVGLAEVPAITSFCLLRHNHRFLTPRTIRHVLQSLPRLQHVDLEFWHQINDEFQRHFDQDLAVDLPFWPRTLSKLTFYRMTDAFNMDEQVWGPDSRFPFLARRIADYSYGLEELAVADLIDADHFFEPFYLPIQRRLRQPYWLNLRLFAMTSTSICSGQPEDGVERLLCAAGMAARRMPALQIMELYNAEPKEGAVFRYLATGDKATVSWQCAWDYKLPAEAKQVWTATAQQHRKELEVLRDATIEDYEDAVWFIHRYLMTRPSLLHRTTSHEMADELDFTTAYRKLTRSVPHTLLSRRQQEMAEVRSKQAFLQEELVRLEALDDDADALDEHEGQYRELFPIRTIGKGRRRATEPVRQEIIYDDDDEPGQAGDDEVDDEAWETE